MTDIIILELPTIFIDIYSLNKAHHTISDITEKNRLAMEA
jgi:hypothetical protein